MAEAGAPTGNAERRTSAESSGRTGSGAEASTAGAHGNHSSSWPRLVSAQLQPKRTEEPQHLVGSERT